ncbi:MAG: CPBP family intramembrane metalloprotease [Flavobacteriia bacterium]|nr:CPBP family intramembrane metalloprotease [Flavobacteriia bacterium]
MAEFDFISNDKRQGGFFTLSFFILLTLFFVFSFLLNPVVSKIEDSNLKFLLILLPFFLSIIFFSIYLKLFTNDLNFKLLISSNKKINLKKIGFAFFIWFIVLTILLLIKFIFQPSNYFFHFNVFSFLILSIISIIFVSFQAFFEELLFRSLLLKAFSFKKNKIWFTILFSSFMFSIMHLNNPEIIYIGYIVLFYYFLSGIFLSILTVLDNGIELSLGFHIANNLFGSLIITNKWQVFQTKALILDKSLPKFSWDIWIILVILYPFCIFLYCKVYKRSFGLIFA